MRNKSEWLSTGKIRALGWLELIAGCFGTLVFIVFLLLSIGYILKGGLMLQSIIATIPITILTIPFPLFLWAGIGIIKQNRWGRKINLILTPIICLWLLIALFLGVPLFLGSVGLFTKMLTIVPVLIIAIGLIINLFILKFLSDLTTSKE